jgi:hypothetical protein
MGIDVVRKLGIEAQTNGDPDRFIVEMQATWKLAKHVTSRRSVGVTLPGVVLAVVFLVDWTSMC